MSLEILSITRASLREAALSEVPVTTLLASMEDFAASRGADFDPTDLQALIALEGASGVVRSYTGQTFDYTEDDEIILDAHGTRVLLLPQVPVHEVSEVAIQSWDHSSGSWVTTETVLDPTDYVLDGPSGLLRRSWGTTIYWPYPSWVYPWHGAGPQIRVVYTHGYVLPGAEAIEGIPRLPAELSLVTMQIASRYFTMAQQGGQLVRAETVGSYSVEYGAYSRSEASQPIDTERLVLDKYRVRTTV